MSKTSQIKILPEEQLKKLSTGRLVNIHRKLRPQLGRLAYFANPDQCFPDHVAARAEGKLAELRPFSDALYAILATREHVERDICSRLK